MLNRPTVLVSDDEPLICVSLARALGDLGVRVVVDLKSDVVELAKRFRPSVILLDYNQGTVGLTLLGALKKDPETRDIDVIMISGDDNPVRRSSCNWCGALDFAAKPFADDFYTRVAALASGHGIGAWAQ